MKQYDILCIGSAIADVIISGFNHEPVSKTGFCADTASLNVGGECINEAITASKLGLKTGVLCFLGNDYAGRMLREALIDNGVDTGNIVYPEVTGTPITTIFVDGAGNRKSITNSAHKFNFHPERFPELLSSADNVTIGSLFRAPFNDPSIIKSVFRIVRENGGKIFADTKLPNFVHLSLNDIKDSLPYVDYIFPNENEAKYYSGKEHPDEIADVFLDLGVKNVIIKLGAEGCFFKNAEQKILLEACRIKAVDATGAGDNFLAGFVSGLKENKGHEYALRFANACGGICTTEVGATTALTDRYQVLRMMEDNK